MTASSVSVLYNIYYKTTAADITDVNQFGTEFTWQSTKSVGPCAVAA